MSRLAELFGDGLTFIYLSIAAFFAFIMNLLRTGYAKHRASFGMRLCEAMMCSMLASAITMLAHLHLGLGYEYAMPVGVFTGYLGSDFISATLIGWIKYRKLGMPEDRRRYEDPFLEPDFYETNANNSDTSSASGVPSQDRTHRK